MKTLEKLRSTNFQPSWGTSFAVVFSAVLTILPVHAEYTQIDIAPQINADLRTYSNGSNYQRGGTQLDVAGVLFALVKLGSGPDTMGIVQGKGPSSSTGPFSSTFSVPAGTRATVLYTLLNTAYGQGGVDEGSIIVTGTGGEIATLNLTEGYNIRDHNNHIFENGLALSNTAVVPTYFLNGAPTTQSLQSRLDRQQLLLPATFAGDTIASITFQGIAHGNPNGSAFLAGLTLVNEPVQMPQLKISVSGTNAILTWPASAYAFTLLGSTDLGDQAVWGPVFPAPVNTNGENVVTTPITNPRQFYRLGQ